MSPTAPTLTVSAAPTSRVRIDDVARAVDALHKWLRAQQPNHHSDEHLNLVLTLKKIPHVGRPTSAFRLPLRHPVAASVCLLVDDRPKSRLSPSAARDLVLSVSLPIPVDVLSLSELRLHCRDDESRQALADAHDLFLADRRIVQLLPSILGSRHFFSKKNMKKKSSKIPVPINLGGPSWTEKLQELCCSTVLKLRSGTCSSVKVARASESRDEIVENVMAAIQGVVGHVPKKWKNVKSFHLKTSESLALPVYQDTPEIAPKNEHEALKKKCKDLQGGNGDVHETDEDDVGSEKKTRENRSSKRKLNTEDANSKKFKGTI